MPNNPGLQAFYNKWCPQGILVCCGRFRLHSESNAQHILDHLSKCHVTTDFERTEAVDDFVASVEQGEWCGSRSTVLRDCHGRPAVDVEGSNTIAAYGLDGQHADLYRKSWHPQFTAKSEAQSDSHSKMLRSPRQFISHLAYFTSLRSH
jgi:hypothetical protein